MKKYYLLTLLIILFFNSAANSTETSDDKTKKGVKLGKEEKYDRAIRSFEDSNKIYNKESSIALHNKGWALEKQGDYEGAIICYEEAIRRYPYLPESFERLGFWKYKLGDYERAVEYGENCLKLDPLNSEVRVWLYDAYKLRTENLGLAAKPENAYYDDLSDLSDPKAIGKNTVLPEGNAMYYGTADIGIRYGMNSRNRSFHYLSSQGNIAPFPIRLYGWARPIEWLKINATIENPYLGASMPKVIGQTENLEFGYVFPSFTIGIGAWLNHYQNDIVFGKSLLLTDFKPGVFIEKNSESSVFSFRFYPRLFPRDGSSSSGYTLDADLLELKYFYRYSRKITYYTLLGNYDYYLFNHKSKVSNFWGYTEFGIGSVLDYEKLISFFRTVSFSLEYRYRVNLRDLNNKSPYKLANGQGLMGFSSKKKNGTRFPGVRSKSNIFIFGCREQYTDNAFFYQSLTTEIVDRHEENHEFFFRVGAGYML